MIYKNIKFQFNIVNDKRKFTFPDIDLIFVVEIKPFENKYCSLW